jgi:hypothetical protein
MKNPLGRSLVKMLALALGIACTQSASAQQFKRVNVKGGASLVQIAAGGASVWARASNGNPYILTGGTFVLANSISLTQIAVGGGNTLQKDAVWGLDSSGNIYKATKSGTSWVFSQITGVLDFIAVGAGYQDNCHPYEVWGLNPAAEIFRYNFCGLNFEQVGGTLATLAVGGGEIWGINADSILFGFNFTKLVFDPVPGSQLTQVTAGPMGAFGLAPGSQTFWCLGLCNPLEMVALTQIQAGGNGVWAIGSAQQIYRLEQNIFSFVQVPGVLVSVSVGTGTGVWGLDSSGKPWGFVTP